MLIIKKGKGHGTIEELLQNCPHLRWIRDPHANLDLSNLHNLTDQCFQEFKRKHQHQRQQSGGGDGEASPLVTDLYQNLRNYLRIHQMGALTKTTMLPYGIIMSTLQLLPDEPELLAEMYPLLPEYLTEHKIRGQPSFDLLMPIGIFLDDEDLAQINNS